MDIVKETEIITPVQSVKRLFAESVQAKLSICVQDCRNKCRMLVLKYYWIIKILYKYISHMFKFIVYNYISV